MFVPDDRLASLIFDYCRWRLSLDPVDLDLPGEKAVLDRALAGVLGSQPQDPANVLRVFADQLAPAVISCDSPRFLAFIPAAPTKASLLFDMVVSCSSLQGTSWLEAAGAVSAENQTLRLLADLAGLPAAAGGCFVSGGSAGNLSALVVARETARRRLGPDGPVQLRAAVSDQAHSSIGKALQIVGMEALVVQSDDHRLTGPAVAAALAADPDPASVVALVATAGTTNAGHHRRPGRVSPRSPRPISCGFTSTGPTAVRPSSRRPCGPDSPGSNAPTRSSLTPTSGSSLRSTAPP